ncbi:hypothetical protein GGQ54_003120 [Naumannella cuiyingiana]|uniref:DUF3093 domain-containing protein n=1 Tax=Naumannella cuiyingiana TaxID=1347891 RepID=A0A7Z0IME8_9ACTN|nr:hypothetical protein [Naumannella cuiyingiana]
MEPTGPYTERQWAPIWWWLVAAALWATLVIAIGAYLPWWAGLAGAVLTGVPIALALGGWGARRVTVDDAGVRAGRSLLEWSYADEPIALDRAAARERLGPRAAVRAWLVTRPWLPEAVELPVRDPADPHPYWLIGTRDAGRLASAIRAARPAAGTPRPASDPARPDGSIGTPASG